MSESNDEEVCDFFKFLSDEVRERLQTLTPEERVEWLLSLELCFRCGKDDDGYGCYCQCDNDD